MSASPQQEDTADKYEEDIEENDQPVVEEIEGTSRRLLCPTSNPSRIRHFSKIYRLLP